MLNKRSWLNKVFCKLSKTENLGLQRKTSFVLFIILTLSIKAFQYLAAL